MSELLRQALQSSTPEERSRVFAELARDLFLTHGRGPIAVRDEQANTVGYLTPPDGWAALFPTDPEWIAEMRRRALDPGVTLSPQEFLDAINRAAQTAR